MPTATAISSAAWPAAATPTSARRCCSCARRVQDITLEAAIPCLSQSDGWTAAQQERYRDLLELCNYRTVVQEKYDPGCMHRRNRYMVDHSSLLLAVHDGSPGGTRYTIEYALRRRKDVLILPVPER